MENLKKCLTNFVSLKPHEWELIAQSIKIETIKKGDYFLNYNQISRKIGWVEEGVFRYIYLSENGTEYTKYFVNEKHFIGGTESFNKQVPSIDAIEALTDANLYTLSFDNFTKLFNQIPSWSKLINDINVHAYNERLKELSPMVVLDAKTRYENFIRSQPDVMQRVSLGCIASYLGMTQQSLSRLRREITLG
jgi:CRP-like cAMP-binding protein